MEERRVRDECFGLPHGGAIFGLFIGVIIIVAGILFFLREAGWIAGDIDILGPVAAIVFGLLIVAGAIYGLTRRR